jgi:hypothetical protein
MGLDRKRMSKRLTKVKNKNEEIVEADEAQFESEKPCP